MDRNLNKSFIAGYERLSAYSDFLNKINVFPVADGDTGTNLRLSLSCLMNLDEEVKQDVIRKLLLSAKGNSGNIAASFLSAFLEADSYESMAPSARRGCRYAWKAVANPKRGTMLSVFEDFVKALEEVDIQEKAERIVSRLKESVKSTRYILPELNEACVVDSISSASSETA
jgi:dihydroxyacetone kinase-like predicted kinase